MACDVSPKVILGFGFVLSTFFPFFFFFFNAFWTLGISREFSAISVTMNFAVGSVAILIFVIGKHILLNKNK